MADKESIADVRKRAWKTSAAKSMAHEVTIGTYGASRPLYTARWNERLISTVFYKPCSSNCTAKASSRKVRYRRRRGWTACPAASWRINRERTKQSNWRQRRRG